MDEQPNQSQDNNTPASPPDTGNLATPPVDTGVSPDPATPTPPNTGQTSVKSEGKKSKVMLIVAIAVVLAAVAVYFYMKNRNSSNTSIPTATTVTPATASDVNGTINAVNSSLTKADSAGDLKASDLANSSLGLQFSKILGGQMLLLLNNGGSF